MRKEISCRNKRSGRLPRGKRAFLLAMLIAAAVLCTGCRGGGEAAVEGSRGEEAGEPFKEQEAEEITGLAHETASDGEVDFEALKEENPDIFAWLHIPGTGIDAPVLQSMESDDYYEGHNAYGEEDGKGALYTELANLTSMCDFNTVIHGKGGEGMPFEGLYQFADPDFFESHEEFTLYLEGNVLTYTVFASYEREDTSLIRSYDFTYGLGCAQFLKDMYSVREMGKNLREGWEEVTPYHFLVTLTTESRGNPGKQFVVLGALTGDAAGAIDRVVEW